MALSFGIAYVSLRREDFKAHSELWRPLAQEGNEFAQNTFGDRYNSR
jgi:hypothetical protein